MNLLRRRFLHLAATAASAAAFPRPACALDYPVKQVRLIVPFAPAGGSDIFARLVGGSLAERFGQQFVIENRPGAASSIGTEVVVRAPPDGYTLLLASSANAINAALYERLSYNFIHDIAPVATMVQVPLVMEVNPMVPAKTVPEFISYAKARRGEINFASAGSGSPIHMAGELFNMMAGVNLVHVPYRGGGAALIDLLGGQVQVMFATMPSSIEYIRAGNLRPLAVTTRTRSEVLPDLPTVGDFVAHYDANDWFGIGAPRNTPAEIIDKLNNEINAALADPNMKARLGDLGGVVISGSPTDFGKLIADETEKWGKVIRTMNIRPE
jgi:tripartite-type tricarboxylate transporter receptor subunit TctC